MKKGMVRGIFRGKGGAAKLDAAPLNPSSSQEGLLSSPTRASSSRTTLSSSAPPTTTSAAPLDSPKLSSSSNNNKNNTNSKSSSNDTKWNPFAAAQNSMPSDEGSTQNPDHTTTTTPADWPASPGSKWPSSRPERRGGQDLVPTASSSSLPRPSYRVYGAESDRPSREEDEEEEVEARRPGMDGGDQDFDEEEEDDEVPEALEDRLGSPSRRPAPTLSTPSTTAVDTNSNKAPKNMIETSAGVSRLQRILSTKHQFSSPAAGADDASAAAWATSSGGGPLLPPTHQSHHHQAQQPDDQFNVGPSQTLSSTRQARPVSASGTGLTSLLPGMSMMLMKMERIQDIHNYSQVADFVGRVVLPPLKVDPSSIGGSMLEHYPASMVQEVLWIGPCQAFESSSGTENVALAALQYPHDYAKHKRSLGLYTGTMSGTKGGRNKVRFVLLARSTNRPLLSAPKSSSVAKSSATTTTAPTSTTEAERGRESSPLSLQDSSSTLGLGGGGGGSVGDYDAMFAADDQSQVSRELSMDQDSETGAAPAVAAPGPAGATQKATGEGPVTRQILEEEEISSFPVLVCMTLNSDGGAPDVRKLISLDQLTTVQDLHATVVQLAFSTGDTVRIDFGGQTDDEHKAVEGALDKERFVWSLLQTHAMLCVAVVERNAMEAAAAGRDRKKFLPPLNVRNLDRAELQYVATVNHFLRDSEALCALLDRQRGSLEAGRDEDGVPGGRGGESKLDLAELDTITYDLMMGNFATRVSLFQTDEEAKDAEEILNSTEWTQSLLSKEETAAVSIAERLGWVLQLRMHDLEAETCRRLIAWEDEKHMSASGKAQFFSKTDERDTVDALALASLFKTLESLDTELMSMEVWLQERVAAIKPLTDDCADIEEENRQLEQQWKSYDLLGAEMRRLLQGSEIDDRMERILKNPASALVVDNQGQVNVEASEDGVEQIYEAGKALQEAMDYPRRSGGLHLKAVAERSEGLTQIAGLFCKALAEIIVTIMEQFKNEVVAGSDHGKVSKSDTHTAISKKIRDTQRKFQSALLGYIKLIEILAALNPDLLPALRDAYSEMVSEGILMKKRMKGYFQALPGKNAAYMNKAGKDLKDYIPFNSNVKEELVNAPDMRAVLSELLPVIAREAYFTSALFGSTKKDQDGREKKRNFESTKAAVDNASQHFRYYINRTCGIMPGDSEAKGEPEPFRGDPMLCLVGSIYLNEAMDNYVDKEKKGGDHSLSLAYVRATILDLRKRADKQWVTWVEKEIEWIKSHDGVPLNGRHAGVFPSFARFPVYLDHILKCCREGRDAEYNPQIGSIKVISYYLQKMAAALFESLRDCVTRESTDKQYASHVMQMENSYYFSQSIKERGPIMETLFAKQITKADAICRESTDTYLGWMVKREFTGLHELFGKISKIRQELGDKDVVRQIPRQQFIRSLSREAERSVLKEKIGELYSRMEKHLSEEGGLLPVAWKGLVKVLFEYFGRWEKLAATVYKYKMDPSAVDVVRIAKAAGGGSKPRPQKEGGEFGFRSILALGKQNI